MSNQTITLYYHPIAATNGIFHHEYLVYDPGDGHPLTIEGGPSTNNGAIGSGEATGAPGNSYGTVKTFPVQEYNPEARNWNAPGSIPSEQLGSGSDLSTQWNQIIQRMAQYGLENHPYSPIFQNSNSDIHFGLEGVQGLNAPSLEGSYFAPPYFGPDGPPGTWPGDVNPFFPPLYPGNAARPFALAVQDPIVIDLGGHGLNLMPQLVGVSPYFDWSTDRLAESTGWIGSGSGLLVHVPTNGAAVSASDLVTSFTQMQVLGTNPSSPFDSSAPGFSALEVWQDTNADGVAQSDELSTLTQLGIQSINLSAQSASQVIAGNTVEAVSSVTMTDGSTHEIAAVDFSYSRTFTQYLGNDTPSAAAALLPQLHGYGNLPDLRESMTQDATLLSLLQNYVALPATDSTALFDAITAIMYRWAGVDGVGAVSRGPGIDGQQLGFLENFLGIPFLDAHGQVNPTYGPELQDLAASWAAASQGIAARLLLQGPMASAFADFIFDPASDLIVCTTSFAQALADVSAQAPTDATAALQFWHSALTILDQYVADWQSIDAATGVSVVPDTQAAYDAMVTTAVPSLTAAEIAVLRSVNWGGSTTTPGGTLYDPHGAIHLEQGNGGADIFVYNAGYGSLVIRENAGFSTAASATLLLGAGILPGDVRVSADSDGNITLADATAGDAVVLDWMMDLGAGGMSQFGVAQVQFDDGTSWSAQHLIDLADTASTTNATLYGFRVGATFTYAAGTGHVEIHEDAGWQSSTTATLVLGAGIAAADLSVSADSAGNIYLADGIAGDQIKIDQMLTLQWNGAAEYGVGNVLLADGTVLTRQQVIALNTTGVPGKTQLYGSSGDDVIDSRGYASYAQGNGGADSFVYQQGYGVLEINEDDGYQTSSPATLALGAGISVSDVHATSDSSGNLFLTDSVSGDQIKLDKMMLASWTGAAEYGVCSVQFADGATLSAQQVLNLADTGSTVNQTLYGFRVGGTFSYASGAGNVEIIEDAGWQNSTTATLMLGAGISPSQVVETADAAGNLYLTDGISGDQIKITKMLRASWTGATEYGVAALQFADGTTFTRQQMINLNTTGAPGKTQLYGSSGGDAFDSRGYANYAQGNGGTDSFVFGAGYGHLEIDEDNGWQTSSPATLLLGAEISPTQVAAHSDDLGNLYLTDGIGGDEVKLDAMMLTSWTGATEYGVASVQFADGTTLTAQQLIDLADTGSATNALLYGFRVGGTFAYSAGAGHVEIHEDAGWQVSTTTTLALGPGITPQQIAATADASGNLYLTDGVSGDQIKLDAMMLTSWTGATEYGVGGVRFSDGTTLSGQQLVDLADTGSAANPVLYGFRPAGTFTYNAGSGHVEIHEDAGWQNSTTAKLLLGSGITVSQLAASSDSTGNLYLTDGIGGDQVKIDAMMLTSWTGASEYGVGSVQLSDGTTLTAQQLIDLADTGATTNPLLYGFRATGTFTYGIGAGHVAINEDAGVNVNTSAVLRLGANILPSQIAASSDGAGNLYLTDSTSGDQLKINAMMMLSGGYSRYGVASVQFADGTTWAAQQLINLADSGTAANPMLYGFRPNGTFAYSAGSGHVEISEDAGVNANSAATLVLGNGIAPAQLAVSTDGLGNIYLTDGVIGDQIKIDAMMTPSNGYNRYGVSAVQFADGTTLSRVQLLNLSTTGVPGRTALYGSSGGDAFDSRGYATYAQGNGGADSFIYNSGYGALEINEYSGATVATTATLQFGTGVSPSQITASADSAGNLYLADGTSGDQIKLDTMMKLFGSSPAYGVGAVQFADGTSWSAQQLLNLADTATANNTILYGFRASGTFTYNKGTGHTEINEYAGGTVATTATLVLTGGILPSQMTAASDSSGNLFLYDGASGDEIKLDNMMKLFSGYAAYGIGTVQFADGTTWTAQQVLNLADTASATNTTLYGYRPSGTFSYSPGSGHIEINEYAGGVVNTTAVLQLGSGIAPSQVGASSDGAGNLYLTDSISGDQIKLDNMMKLFSGSSAYGVGSILFANGTTWTAQQILNLADTASTTNTLLYGFRPAGTFTYAAGNGHVEINEYAGGIVATTAVLQLGAGITPAQIGASADAAGNLYLTDSISGDQIKFDSMMKLFGGASAYGIGSVQFANGTTWTAQQLLNLADTASSSNTIVYGFRPSGTFTYASGSGHIEINEDAGAGATTAAALILGSGITPAQTVASVDASGNIYLTDGVSGDQIKIDRMMIPGGGVATQYGVATVQFANGTTWSAAQVISYAMSPSGTTGTTGADRLIGSSAADIFDGKGGSDYERGNGGADKFIFNPGYGQLEIDADAGTNVASTSTLSLGSGLSLSQVSVSFTNTGDIVLTDGTAGDQVKIDRGLNLSSTYQPEFGVQQVRFSDGTVLGRQQLINLATMGAPGYSNSLFSGQMMNAGNMLLSPGGQYALSMQSDGNLVEYNLQTSAAVWASNTGWSHGAHAVMQTDGNLVIYSSAGSAIWASGTSGRTGVSATLQDDGNFVEYQLTQAVWATNTHNNNPPAPPGGFGKIDLFGTSGADVIDGHGYATYEQGNGGTDTFVFGTGYGFLEINEANSSTPTSIVQLASAIRPASISASTDASGNLLLADGTAGDQIKIDKMTLAGSWGVGSLQFADGTTWPRATLISLATTGSTGNDSITGTTGGDVFDGRGGSDTVIGNGGNDTYIDRPGYSGLIINNSTSGGTAAHSQLAFAPGLDETNIWLAQVGNDLVLDLLGTHNSVTVSGWFGSNASAALAMIVAGDGLILDAQVGQMLSVMTSYQSANPTFSPVTATSMPTDSTLQSTIGAAWHH